MIKVDLRNSIVEALPELELIQNEEYKKAVIDIWEETYKKSEWERLEDVPKNNKVRAYSNVQHTRSVTLQAIACAEIVENIHNIEVDKDVLITSSLLHDISKVFEYDNNGNKTNYGKMMQHGVYSVSKAAEHRLPLEIQHCIVTHTELSKVMPQTIEALILHYVDYLDSDLLSHVLHLPLALKR
mgnify:CR=1 FL=1